MQKIFVDFLLCTKLEIRSTWKRGVSISIAKKIEEYRSVLPEGVTLLAVSKTKPIEDIMEAYNTGVRDFGENKVQELVIKVDELPNDIRWHLIGKLQTNKVKYIVGKVYLIHSLSSLKLLQKIEKEFGAKNITANVLIQINIGREESKSGILEEELEDLLLEIEKCNFVKVKGIMTILPKGGKETNRKYFHKIKLIFDSLGSRQFKNITMDVLSMGMTSDFREAIEEGSNLVRIGSGIFGERIYI